MKAIGLGLSGLFTVVEEVVALDEMTVQFNLSSSYAPFISSLVRLPIVDKQLVMANLGEGEGDMGDWGQAFLSTNGAVTGAYRVVSHNPQDETVMAKNEDYFLPIGEAAPDTVRLRYGLEAPAVRTLIAQGEHDISSQWLPPEVMRALAEEGNQLLSERAGGAFYLKLNTQKAPTDDVNCRQAIANAFDYEAVLKLVAITDTVSNASAPTGAIPVGMVGGNPADQVLTRDLAAARDYLSKCKYDPAEFVLEVSWIAEVPLEERIALLIQANLAEIGIKSEIRKWPWAMFSGSLAEPADTPHLSQLYVSSVTGDTDALLYGQYHSSAAGTWMSPDHLNDPEVDRLLEAGRTEVSVEGREKIYGELNDYLMSIAASVYAHDSLSNFVARPNVTAPTLSDESAAFNLNTMGFTFRLMEVE